jgi:dTDP-4-amino-4,6-dideoxygalactose transaminase
LLEAFSMSDYQVRFNRPFVAGNELSYVADAMQRGRLAGDNLYTQRCHEFLQRLLGVPKALLKTSCTHALEMAALLLEIGPGGRGDRAVLYLRVNGERFCAAGGTAGFH